MAQGNASQYPFGGIIGEANSAVIEETGKARPSLEHIVHGLGQVGVARKICALAAHLALERLDQRMDMLLPGGNGRGSCPLIIARITSRPGHSAKFGFDLFATYESLMRMNELGLLPRMRKLHAAAP